MELTYVLIIAPNFAPPGPPNAAPVAERAEVIPPFKAVLATPLVYLFPQRISYTGRPERSSRLSIERVIHCCVLSSSIVHVLA